MSVELITWGEAPPPSGPNGRTGLLTVEMMQVAAKMRPAEWACYQQGTTTRASAYAHRLRKAGFEAVARTDRVYWRWNP